MSKINDLVFIYDRINGTNLLFYSKKIKYMRELFVGIQQ